jgi:hypothetical protein
MTSINRSNVTDHYIILKERKDDETKEAKIPLQSLSRPFVV